MGNLFSSPSSAPTPSQYRSPSTSNSPPQLSGASSNDGTAKVHKKIVDLGSNWENISADEYYNPEILGAKIFPFPKNTNNKIVLPVKIFLSNITPAMTNMAKALKFFKSDSLLFGPAHAGLQFGNVVIDWNQSSLVHIGELKSSTATVLFEVHESIQAVYSAELEQKAVAFIQKWNAMKKYTYGTWNCHRFVKDFLEEVLSLSLHQCFRGALGEYIEHVIATGDPTPRLKLANYNNKIVTFKNHGELEVIENERWEEEKNEVPVINRKWNMTKEEIKLMKVFHRGFQLQDAARETSCDCFYGNPTTVLEILEN
jgi:hypothetical protein